MRTDIGCSCTPRLGLSAKLPLREQVYCLSMEIWQAIKELTEFVPFRAMEEVLLIVRLLFILIDKWCAGGCQPPPGGNEWISKQRTANGELFLHVKRIE